MVASQIPHTNTYHLQRLDSDEQKSMKMTHACKPTNVSFSKSKRVNSEDMRATLLNQLYLNKLLV